MPESALETGNVDAVVEPEKISEALTKYLVVPESMRPVWETSQQRIFRLLQERHEVDFSQYKPSTISSRIEHRIAFNQRGTFEEYVADLESNPEEVDRLFEDLLIGVTEFFRNADSFEELATRVLPELIQQTDLSDEFRVWVAGCATGEEAYSLAIMLQEQFKRLRRSPRCKIFATDLHQHSLEVAGAGFYPEAALANVSLERRKRFFKKITGGYEVRPNLRQMVVFAAHDLLQDAPFTRMNLVTCRNLLIYLRPPAQTKVLSLFHFGLRPRGCLFLGASETPGELSDEYDGVDQDARIYRKRRDIRVPADLRRLAEYQNKISELTELSNDMDNLLLSTDVHTIFLDDKLAIRKFTPKMAKVFNLLPEDVGRSIQGFTHSIKCDDLMAKLVNVAASGKRYEEGVHDTNSVPYLMRILPYRKDTMVAGVVLTLVDVSELKKAEAKLQQSERKYQDLYHHAPDMFATIDAESAAICDCNETICRELGYSREELLGRQVFDLYDPLMLEEARRVFRQWRDEGVIKDAELRLQRKDGSVFYASLEASSIRDDGGRVTLRRSAWRDITERKYAESQRAAETAVQHVLAESSSIAEAAPRLVEALCNALNVDIAEYWDLDQDSQDLVRTACFSQPRGTEVNGFAELTRETRLRIGEGLVGRIWESAAPLWMTDVPYDVHFLRAVAAARCGLRTAFGFPIRVDQRCYAVLTFFSQINLRKVDASLEMMTALGHYIGQFLARMQAEWESKQAHGRLQELMNHSIAAIFMKDANCRDVLLDVSRIVSPPDGNLQ